MKKKTLGLCILSLIAWTWVLWLYIRYGLLPPSELSPLITQDLEKLGPFALILDGIILFALYLVINPYFRRRSGATEDSSVHEPLDNKTDN